MKFLLVLFLVPCIVVGIKASYNTYEFQGLSFVFKGMYMLDKAESPKGLVFPNSKIIFNYTMTNLKPNSGKTGEMEVAIMSESVFDKMGYKDDNDKKILCCDSFASQKYKCNQNHVLLPENYTNEYIVKSVRVDNPTNNGVISLVIPKTGVYYIVTISCNYQIGSIRVNASYETQHPYGELPPSSYGLYPFTFFLFVGYLVFVVWWIASCMKYSSEIMSVHIIIAIVLVAFVLNTAVKLLYLSVYNKTGYNVFGLSMLSILIDCGTRTMTRVLTLFVCMGLGVTCTQIDSRMHYGKFILFGLVYYVTAFFDSYQYAYPSSSFLAETLRYAITSVVEALVYFWIFISLMDTMDELTEKNQLVKLSIYTKLRNLFIVAVVVATTTLLVFAYLVLNDLSVKMWKYQWFVNDGIWGLFYFGLFFAIMMMWKPSENSSAYAYHIQVATEEKDNDEAYGIANESLVDNNEESHVVVSEISTEMKPMALVEIVQQ